MDSLYDSENNMVTNVTATSSSHTCKSQQSKDSDSLSQKKKVSKDNKSMKTMTHHWDSMDKETIMAILDTQLQNSSLEVDEIVKFLEDTHNRNKEKQIIIAKCLTRNIGDLIEVLDHLRPHLSEKLKMRIHRIMTILSNSCT